MHQALLLALKVMSKTLDITKLTADKFELAKLTRESGKTVLKILTTTEVKELIKEHEQLEAEAEAAKAEKSGDKPKPK